MKKDELGNRMKEQYENRTRYTLPRRTYTIIRIDGKAFHTYTKHHKRPFDAGLIDLMNRTAQRLCHEIQGAQFAYVQSDEISILLTDFSTIRTAAWFDGNIQKICSISASIATAAFNSMSLGLLLRDEPEKERHTDTYAMAADCMMTAHFDSRAFTIPDPVEVENYFIWRQQDASRNSVQMVAQSLFSHRECLNKNNQELQDMIHSKGQNWNDFTVGERRGRTVVKHFNPKTERSSWDIEEPPIFTQDRTYLQNQVPRIEDAE